jgi:hypothetical protein
MEKGQPLQQMLLGKLDICKQKTETRSMSFTLYKFQPKVDKDIKIIPETLKLIQERVGNTLELIAIHDNILNRTQMAQQLREKIDKWDYSKLKSFCTKETVTRLKRHRTESEKIFASYLTRG